MHTAYIYKYIHVYRLPDSERASEREQVRKNDIERGREKQSEVGGRQSDRQNNWADRENGEHT